MKTAAEHPPASISRLFRFVATLVTVLALSGCGGGAYEEDVYVDSHPFDIHVIVGGQPVRGTITPSNVVQRISLQAGQYIEFDANEPVVWDLNVGGTTVSGPGVTIYYGGVAITLQELSSSRILIDSDIRFPLAAPLSITLVATSTIYHDQVARIQVILTP